MKKIGYYSTLLVVVLILFHLIGCGKGEDQSTKAVPGPAASQTVLKPVAPQAVPEATVPQTVSEQVAPKAVEEQKAALPVENNAATSQKAEPAKVTENHSTESAKVTDAQPTGTLDVKEVQPAVQEILDVIVIENKGYTTDKKGPVKFNHVKHNKEHKVPCVECHHLYKDGKNLWKEGDHVDRCVVCHDPTEEKDKVIKLQNAFHKNCKDCHTKVNKEGKEAPYTKCAACHGK